MRYAAGPNVLCSPESTIAEIEEEGVGSYARVKVYQFFRAKHYFALTKTFSRYYTMLDYTMDELCINDD